MKLLLLSKKYLSILVVFVLFIGIIIGNALVLDSKNGQASVTDSITSFFNNSLNVESAVSKDDFDNDGLTDEEEKLYGTDWRRPDSDGDGYLDGEEIASGYNPLRPAPGDELGDRANLKPRPIPKNLTQSLSQGLTSKLANGEFEPISTEDGFDFIGAQQIDDAINDGLGFAIVATTREYSLQEIPDSEIVISSDNSQEAMDRFPSLVTEALTQALKSVKGAEKLNKSDLEAVLEALQTRNFSKLEVYIESLEKIYQAIKKVPVPDKWIEIHKDHLSITLAKIKIIKIIKEIDSDPLKVSLALQQYESINDAELDMIKKASALKSQK